MDELEAATAGLPEQLADDLRRSAQKLGAEEPKGQHELSSLDVLRVHYLVAVHFTALGRGLGLPGVRDGGGLLQSAVFRQHVGFGGVRKWRDPFDIIATLFFGLVKNHAFHDANKRTAILAALYQLQCHHRVANASQQEFEEFTVRVADDRLSEYVAFRKREKNDDAEVRFISDFLKRHTRREDKREYRVSYRQLDNLLRPYRFELVNPRDNRIDVVRKIIRRVGLIRRRDEIVLDRVTTIGFRDWGTEVSGKDVRHVRGATGLTSERGIDSKVFFQGVDPIESLIAEYSPLLRRLARK